MPKLRKRVLLVEDDESVRGLVSGHLRRQGYEVTPVGSAEEVLERVRNGTLVYDVALTDVHLPGLSGIQLGRLLMSTEPLKPVIVITGDSDADLAREALGRGTAGYLLKPFQLFELDAALGQAVAMLELVETTEALARSQAEHLEEWGEAGGMLPRSWLHVGDERSGAGLGHGARVVSVAGLLAKSLGERMSGREREILRTAARTHEIGRLLGRAGEADVAQRTGQLLLNLGFDEAVAEVVRGAAQPWSPGVPLGARILALADRLDHEAVEQSRSAEAPSAFRTAMETIAAAAGDRFDPELVEVLEEHRESMESMWVLQRRAAQPPDRSLKNGRERSRTSIEDMPLLD